jgi:hypothetical protein
LLLALHIPRPAKAHHQGEHAGKTSKPHEDPHHRVKDRQGARCRRFTPILGSDKARAAQRPVQECDRATQQADRHGREPRHRSPTQRWKPARGKQQRQERQQHWEAARPHPGGKPGREGPTRHRARGGPQGVHGKLIGEGHQPLGQPDGAEDPAEPVSRAPHGDHGTYQGEPKDQGHRSGQVHQLPRRAVVPGGEDDCQAGQGEADQAQKKSKPRRRSTPRLGSCSVRLTVRSALQARRRHLAPTPPRRAITALHAPPPPSRDRYER